MKRIARTLTKEEEIENFQAAYFYISDLRDSLETTDANVLTKRELVAQITAWRNSMTVAESLMEEVLKNY